MDEEKMCDMCGSHLLVPSSQAAGRCTGCRVNVAAIAAMAVDSGGHPGFLKLLDEIRSLHLKKAADYGRGADPFANVRASAEFGIPAWVGVMVRANDKVQRIKSFITNGKLVNESVRDSLMDLAAYALIALALFDEDEAAKNGGKA